MSGAVPGALARLRLRLPKLPGLHPGLNASGSAGPRRLALTALLGVGTLAVVAIVALSGRTPPPMSRDAKLQRMDPLPGGLHSSPEQDALSLTATDQEANAAWRKGVSYTPVMGPSQPATPLPAPVPKVTPVAATTPTFVGRPVKPAAAPAPAASSQAPRVTEVAATAADLQAQAQAQQVYSRQIGDLFSQWGGRAPRTDVILPPTLAESEGGDPSPGPRGGTDARARDAGVAALPVSAGGRDLGQILVPAGRGVYAHPVLALSSDETSPVVLQADTGPIAGDRMIGSFSRQSNRLIIHVHSIIHNGENIGCDGVVTAPDTMEASVASKVDEHYAARFLLPAAAAFVAGLGQAIETTSNTTAVLSPFGGATTTTRLNLPKQLGIAAGTAAQQLGSTINQEAPKGPTISLEANVAVGVMFLSNVTSRGGG